MRRIWPFKAGGVKMTPTKFSCTLENAWRYLRPPMSKQSMWTYKHYLPPSLGWMIYKMKRTLYNNIHFCVQWQKFTLKKGEVQWTLAFECLGTLILFTPMHNKTMGMWEWYFFKSMFYFRSTSSSLSSLFNVVTLSKNSHWFSFKGAQ